MDSFSIIQSKIKKEETFHRLMAYWRFKNEKIVFTNGCFDILHPGHIEYLMKAADLGSRLIVGLNTDASVSRLKGSGRPLQNQEARAIILAGLSCVDAIVLFDEDTPLELIKETQPDVLVKGGDYERKNIVGYKEVSEKGGEVIVIPFVEGFSSTKIISELDVCKK